MGIPVRGQAGCCAVEKPLGVVPLGELTKVQGLTFVMAGNEVQQFVSQNETQGLVRWLADKSDDSSLIPKDLHGGPYFPKLSSDST